MAVEKQTIIWSVVKKSQVGPHWFLETHFIFILPLSQINILYHTSPDLTLLVSMSFSWSKHTCEIKSHQRVFSFSYHPLYCFTSVAIILCLLPTEMDKLSLSSHRVKTLPLFSGQHLLSLSRVLSCNIPFYLLNHQIFSSAGFFPSSHTHTVI